MENRIEAQANPYAPPKAVVSDAGAEAGTIEPASRGSRLGAATVDGLITLAIVLPISISMAMGLIAAGGATEGLDAMSLFRASSMSAMLVSLVLSIAWIAVTFVLVARNGQTIGKKIVGIKVVRSDGSKASLGRIFWLRNVVNALPSFIPVVGSIYGLVDHLLIFSEKRQCVHDKIADTIVVPA